MTKLPFICLAVPAILAGCTIAPVERTPSADGDTSVAELFPDDTEPATAKLDFVVDELLVAPMPGADRAALLDLYREVDADPVGEVEELELAVLRVDPDNFNTAASKLAVSNMVEEIHKNYIIPLQALPDDPELDRQGHLDRVRAPEAWDLTTGDTGVIIAIVDTGVDRDHPDLEGRIIDGWNVYDDNGDYSDPVGHGTHVAGVIAAESDNRLGVAGITWNNPLIVVRAGDREGFTTSRDAAAGILWAAGRGAKVINLSFAPLWSNTVVRSAARQAYNRGSLVVISAGNGGGSTRARGYFEALFVGALDDGEVIAEFSDQGPFVDMVAPGTSIRSTTLNGRYASANGTSFAAPIVAGAAALAWSVNPDLRPVSIINALTTSAVDRGAAGKDSAYGHGGLDIPAALNAAEAMVFESDRTAPRVTILRLSNGSVLSRRAIVSVSAEDSLGVADVVMSVDGVPYATDSRFPYRFLLDTTDFSPGEHELSFVATDLSGNASRPAGVTVRFSNGGSSSGGSSVSFRSPASGSSVSGDTLLRATVTSGVGLATVEWLIDGNSALVSTVSGNTSDVTYMFRPGGLASGEHTVTLVMTDLLGNTTSDQIRLVVR